MSALTTYKYLSLIMILNRVYISLYIIVIFS